MKTKPVLLIVAFIALAHYSFSQKADSTNSPKAVNVSSPKIDSTKKELFLKANAAVTNKGISYIPSFSLGKPAMIFDMSMGNGKLFFEPQLRFSLKGEPWTFLFPVRYKIKASRKIQMTLGAIPLLSFKNVACIVHGVSTTELVNRRYLGGDFRPNYFFTENISVGAYYMYFRGISNGALKNTSFVSLNTNFSNIKIGKSFFARFSAQFYYLDQDGLGGFYFNPVLALLKRDFPLSVQTIMNAAIRTNMPGSEPFIWNVSLIYAFNKKYIQK